MKNIVVCCDGTGNEIGIKMSNVLKLYRMLDKNDAQVVYYHPGVGTLGQRKTWGLIKQELKGFLGLATGYGLDDEVLSGAEIEATVSGRDAADCDEAAGATRIKRLRDTLGNQMVSELLVKNIARRGYILAIDKDVIQVL